VTSLETKIINVALPVDNTWHTSW